MSPREQLLQKRVAYLEARSNALMMVLDRAIDDIERAESVACAFAFDLGLHEEGIEQAWLIQDMKLAWASALIASSPTATELAIREASKS